MKKAGKWILIIFVVLLVSANVAVWITGTTYIYKALIYQNPNIDDLDLFDYNTVKNTGPRKAWQLGSDYNQQSLTDSLRKVLTDNESVAFLVIKDDSIRYEEYWDGYSDESFSNSFSMAKSIVSILIGIAIDEGKITSEEDEVGMYVPEYNEGERAKIKIRHVLEMASGLNFHESYNTPFNQTTDAYYGKDLRKIMFALKVEKEPGTEFSYKSGDTQLLEMVLRSATGQTVSEYASEKLWSKIGAEHEARWSVDHKGGDEKAYCCFYSNARDFARIGKLYMNNGKFDNTRVVSADWVKKSLTPHGLADAQGVKTDYYGYQWWIYPAMDYPVFYCRGILGQYIISIPSKKMIIVRLGHKRSDKKIGNHPVDVVTFIRESVKIFG